MFMNTLNVPAEHEGISSELLKCRQGKDRRRFYCCVMRDDMNKQLVRPCSTLSV